MVGSSVSMTTNHQHSKEWNTLRNMSKAILTEVLLGRLVYRSEVDMSPQEVPGRATRWPVLWRSRRKDNALSAKPPQSGKHSSSFSKDSKHLPSMRTETSLTEMPVVVNIRSQRPLQSHPGFWRVSYKPVSSSVENFVILKVRII